MRDIGILVWVGLLIVGVVGSMISSLRRQAQQGQAPPATTRRVMVSSAVRPEQLPPWLQQMAAEMAEAAPPPPRPAPTPRPSAAPPAVARAEAPPVLPFIEPAHVAFPGIAKPRPAYRVFAGREGVVRGVIAAEVLGKPRALRDEYP